MPLTNEQLMNAAGLTPEQKAGVLAGVPTNPGTIDVSTLNSNPTVTPVFQPTPVPVITPISGTDTTVPGTKTNPLALTPEEIAAQKTSEDIQKLNEANVGQTTYRATQEAAVGVPEMRKTQTDLTARLAAINAEAKAIPLALQNEATGQGITAAGLAPIQTARLRENAINALTTSALLEASRGNLTTALDTVDRAVTQKFGPIQEEIAAKTKNLQMIMSSPEATVEEKNRAQQQLDIQNSLKVANDKALENYKQILTISTNAAQAGASSDVLDKISKSTDPVAALKIASDNGVAQPKKALPASAQEYEYAVQHGYKGSYTQYQTEDANRKRAITMAAPTVTERNAQKLADYGRAFIPGATINGAPVIDQNGYITPLAWKHAIDSAVVQGLSRADFIKQFGSMLYTEGNAVSPSYGITPAEEKLITG